MSEIISVFGISTPKKFAKFKTSKEKEWILEKCILNYLHYELFKNIEIFTKYEKLNKYDGNYWK